MILIIFLLLIYFISIGTVCKIFDKARVEANTVSFIIVLTPIVNTIIALIYGRKVISSFNSDFKNLIKNLNEIH